MVQRDLPGPVGAGFQQRLVPDFGLRARVGEHQRGGTGFDFANHRRHHGQPQMPRPRKTFNPIGQQGVHRERFGRGAAHQPALRRGLRPQQGVHRLIDIAQRGRHAPDPQTRVPAPQPRYGQLRLHAALVTHQLVPFVHHQQRGEAQLLLRVCARDQEAQAFGGGHQRRGQAGGLLGAFAAAGVAAARTGRPRRRQLGQRRLQRAQRVGRQRPHGRKPDHRERRRAFGFGIGQRLQRAQPHRVGLACAGRSVQQAALAARHRVPNLALKGEGRPVAGGHPGGGIGWERWFSGHVDGIQAGSPSSWRRSVIHRGSKLTLRIKGESGSIARQTGATFAMSSPA